MNDPRLTALGDTPGSDVCGCGRIEWAPDYGLPIMRPTQCKTGTHIWMTTGRIRPEPGQRCTCGLRQWPDEDAA